MAGAARTTTVGQGACDGERPRDLVDALLRLEAVAAFLARGDPPRILLREALDLVRDLTAGSEVSLLVPPEVLALLGREGERVEGRLALGPGSALISEGPEADEIRDWEGSHTPVVSLQGTHLVIPCVSGGLRIRDPGCGAHVDPGRVALLHILADLAAGVAAWAAQLAEARRRSADLEVTRARLREQNILLRELAVVDELTGLYNRRFFEGRLQYELDRLRRYGMPLALLLIDIDHFKKVNDTWGHLVGDDALRQVADLARSLVRSVDLLARFGGEELAVLMPETRWQGARDAAERIRAQVEATPLAMGQALIHLTISVGVAAVEEGWSGDNEQLVRAADQALYRAKTAGRNRVVSAGEEEP